MRKYSLGATLWRRLVTSAGAVKEVPLLVKQTASAGRGVFASRDIAEGELILSTEPFVAHPKPESISRVCYHCLKEINDLQSKKFLNPRASSTPAAAVCIADGDQSLASFRGAVNSQGGEAKFCSIQCAAKAEKFMVVERRADWSGLEQHCDENGLKFPLVVRRLACMIVAGTARPDALGILSFSILSSGRPSHWNDERSLLVTSLRDAGFERLILEFLTENWYSGIISRLHINAFAVEMISIAPSSNLLEAATSSISGEGSVGSAVYILPSMFNHDCDPNVDVSWSCNSTIRLVARQDVSAGDELRITYVDASIACDARQEMLNDSYGFLCDCLRCQHRD